MSEHTVQPYDVGRIIALTTAAVRDADNAERLLGPLRRLPRLDLRMLSGQEEALLGARAVASTMALQAGVVVDLGGGSPQITTVRGGEAHAAASVPLGAVRVTAINKPDKTAPTGVTEVQKLTAGPTATGFALTKACYK